MAVMGCGHSVLNTMNTPPPPTKLKTVNSRPIRYNPRPILQLMNEGITLTPNKARAFFALSGYHFNPDDITRLLGIEPTSVDAGGLAGRVDKPTISSWELSTETITSETQDLDIYKLIDDEILKKIEPIKDQIIEICKSHNLSPRISVELTLSVDKDETSPEVGFGARVVKFCSEIGAFINIDYQLSERV